MNHIGDKISSTTSAVAAIASMSVDDANTAFAAANTALNSGGATITSLFDANLDSTPTRTNQTVSHVMTIPTGSGNFTIRRVALHNAAAASVDSGSSSLIAGVDGQALTKTSDFSLEITLQITYSSI